MNFALAGTMKIVVELTARLGDKLKCAMSENDCSEHVSCFSMKILQEVVNQLKYPEKNSELIFYSIKKYIKYQL